MKLKGNIIIEQWGMLVRSIVPLIVCYVIYMNPKLMTVQILKNLTYMFTHRGPVDLRKWAIFNTILMSPKSWLPQEDLDAGCEHSLVPIDS